MACPPPHHDPSAAIPPAIPAHSTGPTAPPIYAPAPGRWIEAKYRLRNEDFEFPDLLGAAYEYLVREFADSAGKKGGEFYTPRSVVRMMVRLIEPREGMRIYDPCSGSGGMLILSKEYVEEYGGNPRNLALFGQENNGGVWSISKMNLLLHGIPDADIRNADTLAEPLHTEGGELMRFDRMITSPPFSLNYTKDGIPFPERFRYGWCPEGGKKADLMFVQHMISALRPQGTVATVMPHGVLFRGGAEREIRKGLLDDDLLDAVIGLAPNLFYGTGIPACILVLCAKGAKPTERRRKVLLINADAEFAAGRAQNYLLPEHVEKIVSAYHAFADIPGYATVVTHDELLANDGNLNIRRYADNAPPPEPHDVRAHLVGGIPRREVADKSDLFAAHGFDPTHVLVERDADYYDFPATSTRPIRRSRPGRPRYCLMPNLATKPTTTTTWTGEAARAGWRYRVAEVRSARPDPELARAAALDHLSEGIVLAGDRGRGRTPGAQLARQGQKGRASRKRPEATAHPRLE